MKNVITIICLSILLAGCAGFNAKPSDVVVSADRYDTCGKPSIADPIMMREVLPIVIEDKQGLKWIGIIPRHYENLSINTQSMLKHIKQQKNIIDYLLKCKNN